MEKLSSIISVLVALIVGPLLAIWSLNTLFGLGIAYSIKTWFAALVCVGIVDNISSSKQD